MVKLLSSKWELFQQNVVFFAFEQPKVHAKDSLTAWTDLGIYSLNLRVNTLNRILGEAIYLLRQ